MSGAPTVFDFWGVKVVLLTFSLLGLKNVTFIQRLF